MASAKAKRRAARQADKAARRILAYADWDWLADAARPMGILHATPGRGEEIFAFEYDPDWLKGGQAQSLDPNLHFYEGRQISYSKAGNFGLFLDSAPDRWGRVVMQRREAEDARAEGREPRTLTESDYLLGVSDLHRVGGMRFKLQAAGPFLDDRLKSASPPITSIRALETASLEIEAGGEIQHKEEVRLLLAPGASLGGSRPKSGVVDKDGTLFIAKFPSRNDDYDMGAWEHVVLILAKAAGIDVADGYARKFSGKWSTFMVRRFDRTANKARIHFASAMTLLGKTDGDGAQSGVSYLDIAKVVSTGAKPDVDLPQLWRRIAFNVCASNADDHLRNHGFLLTKAGWVLSPAYDMNPVAYAKGLNLNISEHSNALDLDLVIEVAPYFRVKTRDEAKRIALEIAKQVANWRRVAASVGLSKTDQDRMGSAFRLAEQYK
jgi:serine/threonine-protein kinase HipA